eukprot:1077606-Alexandrium_andersonii.AAC.1
MAGMVDLGKGGGGGSVPSEQACAHNSTPPYVLDSSADSAGMQCKNQPGPEGNKKDQKQVAEESEADF